MNKQELRDEYNEEVTVDVVCKDVDGNSDVIKATVDNMEYEKWLEQKIIDEREKVYGKSELDKYIPFVNQGRDAERDRVLKVINIIAKSYTGSYPDKNINEIIRNILKSLKSLIEEKSDE